MSDFFSRQLRRPASATPPGPPAPDEPLVPPALEERVHYFEMGASGKGWRHSAHWPPIARCARFWALTLDANGGTELVLQHQDPSESPTDAPTALPESPTEPPLAEVPMAPSEVPTDALRTLPIVRSGGPGGTSRWDAMIDAAIPIR